MRDVLQTKCCLLAYDLTDPDNYVCDLFDILLNVIRCAFITLSFCLARKRDHDEGVFDVTVTQGKTNLV